MSLKTPGEHHDQNEIQTMDEFNENRIRLSRAADSANNPDGIIITASFMVQKPGCGPDDTPIEVIESVSPEIRVYTSSSRQNDINRFTMTLSWRDITGIVDVDSDNLSLMKAIHNDFILKFRETKKADEALIWLVEKSKYSALKGKKRNSLLMFKY